MLITYCESRFASPPMCPWSLGPMWVSVLLDVGQYCAKKRARSASPAVSSKPETHCCVGEPGRERAVPTPYSARSAVGVVPEACNARPAAWPCAMEPPCFGGKRELGPTQSTKGRILSGTVAFGAR